MNKNKYIAIFGISILLVIVTITIYLTQLQATVNNNLMSTVDEISRHDVESIEGALENSFKRLETLGKRIEVSNVTTVEEAQEQLNLAAASSNAFSDVLLVDSNGVLYGKDAIQLMPDEHSYDEMFMTGRDHFVMLYDDVNGRLDTDQESLIYGIKLWNMVIEGHSFIGMLGRSDMSYIRDQLLIESFDGEGISSVVNAQGYYIVRASAATEIAGRSNFYDMLRAGTLEDGITIDQVRQRIADEKHFVINCTTQGGQRLVLSFAPVEGTSWAFIMAVPRSVFEDRFTPFFAMTVTMLIAMVIVLGVVTILVYLLMRHTVRADAEAAARSEFLSNMSHEIRTPLNGIIGLNHLMAESLDDKTAMEGYVRKLGKTAKYLLSLVNDILDVSKLQAGKVELVSEPFDLYSLIDNVCEMQREAMKNRGIDFELKMTAIEYPHLIGDEVRVSQVLMNILSNAVKFTPGGGHITFSVTQQHIPAARTVNTSISIADTGCGMTREFQEHIFDVFTQERNAIDASQKGTGLGMAITYMLATEMGGRISLESEVGVGSTFVVDLKLPIDPAFGMLPQKGEDISSVSQGDAQAGEETVAEPEEHAPAEDALNILVAEDNELNADILSAILEREGYVVRVTVNGEEAVGAFKESRIGEFAAILMDAQMPVMDGYEAAKAIRKLDREDAATVRIFACTASTFAEDRNRALESGMDDFLAKPLDVPDMLKKLQSL